MVDKATPFVYSARELTQLQRDLSTDRFGSYLNACAGDAERAVQLYVWNTAVGSAFAGPLQAVEVVVRNAVNERLAANHGAWWLENSFLLAGDELRMARSAKEQIQRRGKNVTAGRVVAELGFGFWVGLFANRYDETLWRTELYRLFSPTPKRRDLHQLLDRLRTLRNRIAHHEPIHQRKLLDDYQRLVDVLGMASPTSAEWVKYHSRVFDILAASPEDVARF